MEIGNTLILSNKNEYAIVDKYDDNGTTYIYLVDINNNTNFIFGKIVGNSVETLTDPDELEKVIKTVNDRLHNTTHN